MVDSSLMGEVTVQARTWNLKSGISEFGILAPSKFHDVEIPRFQQKSWNREFEAHTRNFGIWNPSSLQTRNSQIPNSNPTGPQRSLQTRNHVKILSRRIQEEVAQSSLLEDLDMLAHGFSRYSNARSKSLSACAPESGSGEAATSLSPSAAAMISVLSTVRAASPRRWRRCDSKRANLTGPLSAILAASDMKPYSYSTSVPTLGFLVSILRLHLSISHCMGRGCRHEGHQTHGTRTRYGRGGDEATHTSSQPVHCLM